jgi:hypothetical protein
VILKHIKHVKLKVNYKMAEEVDSFFYFGSKINLGGKVEGEMNRNT